MKNERFYDIIDSEIDKLSVIFKDNEYLKKQNDNGKKSFSFLLWFLSKYLPNTNLNDLENLITEGADDSSADLIFNNTDQNGNKIFYVVQAKWFNKNKINKVKGLTGDLKACLSDFNLILSGKKRSVSNKNFNKQYDKFIRHKKKNGKVKFIFLALSGSDLKIKEYIDNFITTLVSFDLIDFFKLKQQYIEIEYKGVKTHNPIETPYIPKTDFDLEIEKEQVIYIKKPYESNIFLVKPKEIYSLFEKYGHSLFYKNIRNPLPNSYFNKEITNTIKNNPVNFWYFNNGITAITDSIQDFHNDSTVVTIKGLQIINGAQTVYSIFQAYKRATDNEREIIDRNALITLRIIESGGADFDLKITRFTNSQNPISERDFHSNDDVQKRIQLDFFRHTNVWYETRRGEFRKTVRGVRKLTNEKLGQCYLAYYLNDPFNAKQSKKLFFLSTDINSKGLYEKIFNENTKHNDMLISYYLNLYVDKKRKSYKRLIKNIDTSKKLSESEMNLLKFDFVQYANFDIMALFKVLLYEVNNENSKQINGKIISYYENKEHKIILDYYIYIVEFLKNSMNELKKIDSTIVYSVLFKNKEFYPTIKDHFLLKIRKENLNYLKL